MRKAIALDICGTETQPAPAPTTGIHALAATATSFVLVDPILPDAPAVYVSEAFEQLTGYSTAETNGRNDEGVGFNFAQYTAPDDLQTSERGGGLPILCATACCMRMIGGELQLQFDLEAEPEEES